MSKLSSWPYNTARWRKLRRLKLAEQPLCEDHLARGRLVPADTVDHVKAIAAGGDPFPPLEGLSSKCASCHNYKTNIVDHPNSARTRKPRLRGVGLDGYSLDPSDHFKKPMG